MDPVALLLPDAAGEELELARRVTRAMQVFSSDAVDSGSPSVRVQLPHAREELGVVHAGEMESALQDLLIHTARQCYPPATFMTLAAPRHSHSRAWGKVFGATSEAERRRLVLDVPRPGESPLSVLERLLCSFQGLVAAGYPEGLPVGSVGALTVALWRYRLGRLRVGFLGPEEVIPLAQTLQDLLGQLARPRSHRERELRASTLAELIALRLDSGNVTGAEQALGRAGPTAQEAADCRSPLDLLGVMTRWLAGGSSFPEMQGPCERCTGQAALPGAWREVELQGSKGSGESRPKGAGPRSAAFLGPAPKLKVALQRQTLGAQAVVVSVLAGDGSLRPVFFDVAPGLRDRLGLWARRHRHSLGESGTPEHEAGRRAEAFVIATGAPGGAAASALERFGIEGATDLRRPVLGGGGTGEASARGSGPGALVIQPLFDAGGELLGLLWIELKHRLLPAASLRRAVGAVIEEALLDGALPRSLVDELGADSPKAGAVQRVRTHIELKGELGGTTGDPGRGSGCLTPPLPTRDMRERAAGAQLGRAWDTLVHALQFKTAERRWIAFHVVAAPGGGSSASDAPGPGLRLVMAAQGGEAGDRMGEPSEGGTWALRRALCTGGAVRYGTGDGDGERGEPVMLHAGAVSGAAIPLRREGQVVAILSVESTRHGDAREKDVERWYAELQARGAGIEAAIFSANDRCVFDGGFALSPEDPDVSREFERLCALGASHADVLVTGPVGSGRKTAARFLHHARHLRGGGGVDRGPDGAGRLMHRGAFGLEPTPIEELGAGSRDTTLLISDIEWLSSAAQAALMGVISRSADRRPRVIATLGGTHDDTQGPGTALHPDLVRRLSRAVHRCLPLTRRRHVIPGLARFLLQRIRDQEAGPGAELTDEAVALLWRQPWVDNVAGLEAVLCSSYLRAARRFGADSTDPPIELCPSKLQAAMLDGGLEPLARVPSRSPLLSDVHSALWATQTATTRINKTRAAMYLGWDPNTLAARLKEEGLSRLAQVSAALAVD